MNLIEKFEQWLRWPSDATSLYRVSFWILLAIVTGLIAVLTQQSAVVWGLSALASGGLLGFLFGIPRVQQSEVRALSETDSSTSSAVVYRQTVNTNLTEISDWLTKIIVGVSLV